MPAAKYNHIRNAQDVKKQLEMTDCKILGAILNKVDTGKNGYYSGYYKVYFLIKTVVYVMLCSSKKNGTDKITHYHNPL